MWHEMVASVRAPTTTEVTGNAGTSQVRGVIDTKAMRKIGADEVLFGAVELGTEAGTAALSFGARTRMLVMLP